ncbi:MAG: homoserine dehydrogenase [Gammaproteobacteria bacterium WSBS_2016_MAG_OTU1]
MSSATNSLSQPPLKVAVVGAGTVGGGVLQLLRQNSERITAQCGRQIQVCAIAVRNIENARSRLSAEDAALLTDWQTAAAHPQADVVVEMMGGETDAKECISIALANGKAVVTANKALLAIHGDAIFAAAHQAQKPVAFEAAVAGCIPIIKTIREALAGDDIYEAAGIINGTCNHIISTMSQNGLTFEAALAEAQALGYAEADPTLDIDGVDAAHKIALIARLAFNARPTLADFPVVGLRDFDLRDIHYAGQFGFCIKLLAQARRDKNGVAMSVQPTLIAKTHPLAAVHGAMNAILLRAVFSGETMYYGAGAGGHPTAVAIVADLIDIARQNGALTMQNSGDSPTLLPAADFRAAHFLRLRTIDRPGALAEITGELAKQDISIEAIHQNESAPGQEVDIIFILHEITRGRIEAAVSQIEKQTSIFGKIVVMPIQRFCSPGEKS